MAVSTKQVFLVPGQRVAVGTDGSETVSPTIENCVVIANSAQDAQAVLEVKAPGFRALGFTTLAEFEAAVVKLRQALNGEDNGWPLVIAEGILG